MNQKIRGDVLIIKYLIKKFIRKSCRYMYMTEISPIRHKTVFNQYIYRKNSILNDSLRKLFYFLQIAIILSDYPLVLLNTFCFHVNI